MSPSRTMVKKAGVEPQRAVQAFMVEGEVKKTLPRLWKRLLTRWRVLSSCMEEEEEEELSRSMMVVDCPAKQLMLGIARTIVYVFFFCDGESISSGEVCCAAAAAAVSKFIVIADCMSFTVTPAKTLMMIFPRRESLI